MSLLLYPQFVLAFWAPLIVLGAWQLTRPLRLSLSPRVRFWLAWGVALFPLLALFVPYLPGLPLRETLPYRVPIAWGVFSPDLRHASFWYALAAHLPFFLTFGGLLLAFAAEVAEQLTASWRVARLPQHRKGDVRVLEVTGDLAFTLGVLRPRVYLSASLWHGPHQGVILAHERAHARAKHPPLLALARLTARTWWYLPPAWSALREVELAAELWADGEAVRAAGPAPLARALRHALEQKAGSPLPSAAFAARGGAFAERVLALRRATRGLPLWTAPLLICAYLALLILL